jgi:hypothetical protein
MRAVSRVKGMFGLRPRPVAPPPAHGGGVADGLACRHCGVTLVRPIVYGAPNSPIMALAYHGAIVPGGAMARLLSGEAPNWECGSCRHRWRGGLFAGGDGDSIEQAVIIRGVTSTAVGIRAEKQYLTERFGLPAEAADPEPGWILVQQALLHHDGRPHDALSIALPDGRQPTVFFDVSSFFGRGGL